MRPDENVFVFFLNEEIIIITISYPTITPTLLLQ